MELDETDRIFSCPFCQVRLFIHADGPLRYYLNAVRGLFLKGTGLHELWPDAVVLPGWGAGILAIAVAKFHKRLD